MKISRDFYKYVIPSMLSFALSGIYAIVDGFFVGNAMGDNALAAINIAYPITAFMQAVGTGIGMGGAVRYSICKGADDQQGKNKYLTTSMVLLVAFGVLLTALFLLGGRAILQVFGAEGEILTLADEYIRYITYGTIFQVLGTGVVPFIRNMGSSITAMIGMISGFLTNILLDYLFVWVFQWGMMGAAVATVIGQAATFAVCLVFMVRKNRGEHMQLSGENRSLVKNILLIGLSPFGLTFSPNLTLILVNKSAVVFGGSEAVTCYAAISYISCVVLLLLQGVSDGSQPLISVAYGEGNLKKAKAFRNLAYRFAAGVAIVLMIAIFLTRGDAARLFGASEQVVQDVASALPIFIAGFLFASFSRITTSYFYATEKNVFAYLLIYGEPTLLLLSLLILPHFLGIWGTWTSVLVSQVLIMVASMALNWLAKKRETPEVRIEKAK